MSKSHVINVNIVNNSDFNLSFADDWFDTGRLAGDQSWPSSIAAHGSIVVQCCESDFSPVGCSGWVKYIVPSEGIRSVYFSFSNPSVGQNGIAAGNETSIWDSMTSHYGYPVSKAFDIDSHYWATVNLESTSGSVNNAQFQFNMILMNTISESNIQLKDVRSVFERIPTVPSYRKYYKCGDSPTGLPAIGFSHFKGISYYSNKLIFTHTNVIKRLTLKNGSIIVADCYSGGGQAETDITFPTYRSGWPHPCSSQACGSFMAMGIQEGPDEPESDSSVIQILDIRACAVNLPASLIGTIPRPTIGSNGVGMTKQVGADGKYIVAVTNGETLTIYRSISSSLLDANNKPTSSFKEILPPTYFRESGAGIALVTQQDGKIFAITMNADDNTKNSKACLYELSIGEEVSIVYVTEVDLPILDMSESVTTLANNLFAVAALGLLFNEYGANLLNSSFRWGKGLAITSSDSIELYASDRNVLPLSSLPIFGSDKDFSVVVWKSS
ncbi:hypothetical protein ABNM01_17370 [Pseudomonas syringae]|uniref:hypothetical protein n=1 Tax=Pseudomonas syringae group TaxID=136849 RepID=UPI000F3BE171|nr:MULTISPECIES: hypothetical protein [Pseudomonas syringae group]MCQ3018591.1 hypothetical protein [Pseudomonas tremae]QGL58616.1 hypothetical protein POR16_20850 [Pseudomonas coronafaciens pv. oryzae str. 1_6]RMM36704.1 hypothetical protein ALQ80_200089 [Pseudomonas coronafaciens pv. oryzae]